MKKLYPFFSILICLLGTNLLWAEPNTKITILYTGDTYGFGGRDGYPGGLAKRKVAIDRVRLSNPNTILVDNGNALGQFYYSRFDQGEMVSRIMSDLGYNAFNVGVHDFDYGQPQLLNLTSKHHLPVLSSNVLKSDRSPFLPMEIRMERKNIRIAILGLCDPLVGQKTIIGMFNGLQAKPPLEALKEKIGQIRNEVDLIVVLANLGYYESEQIAKEVNGIDLLISRSKSAGSEYEHMEGDSPYEFTTLFSSQDPKQRTLLATASRYGYHLGQVDFSFEKDSKGYRIVDLKPSVIDLGAEAPEDPEMRKQIKDFVGLVKDKWGKVLISDVHSQLGGPFDKERFSKLLLTLMKEKGESEISLINETAFSKIEYTREQVEKDNKLRESDIQRLFWTDNYLVKTTLKGAQIAQALKEGEDVLWVDGVRKTEKGITINGRQLDKDEEYTVATSNYLVSDVSPIPSLREGRFLHENKNQVLRTMMIDNIIDEKLPEKKDDYVPQWRLLMDNMTAKISNFDAYNNGAFGAVRDARVQSVDTLAIGGSGRFCAQYESRPFSWFNVASIRFLQLEIDHTTINNPQDNILLYTQGNANSWGFSGMVPFLQTAFETEFTPAGGNPRNRVLRFTPGLTTTWNNLFEEFRLGASTEVDFSLNQTNYAEGLTFLYRLSQPISKSGILFQSDLDVRYFPYFKTSRTDDLLVSVDTRNRLQIPVIGYLYLSPEIEYFVYRGAAVKETGTNLFLSIGITYSRLWKPGTQTFIP